MKLPRSKSLQPAALPALGLLVGLLSACSSTPGQYENHWNVEGLQPRLAYNFLGYKPYLADSYRDYSWQQKQDINLTLRRHMLNNNPLNPFEPGDPSLSEPRPPHSILPDPVDYFHVEAIAFGAAFSVLTGTFIPVPFGSIFGTLEEGGFQEFSDGIHQTASGNFRGTLAEPSTPAEFRVRNTKI
jgi:hypothetical protein